MVLQAEEYKIVIFSVFLVTVEVRSNSRYSGRILCETESGMLRLERAFAICSSNPGFTNENNRQIAIESTFAFLSRLTRRVISALSGDSITSPADVTRAIRGARTKKTFPLTLMREKRETTVSLTIEDNNEDRSERRMFLWHDGDGDVRMDPGGYQFHFEDGELPKGSVRIRTIRN